MKFLTEGQYIIQAIKNLSPNAEFSFQEEDLSTLKWDNPDILKPSNEQIMIEVNNIKTIEAQTKAEVAVKRQALLNKLGITEDEAQLLLGGN